ncbi:MAG: hypothetical protein FD189_2055 [Elusimicrobia bacterium]|nr:MAG: hypothetical protein FD154_2148 [Elusimicrobiota bacterium]KAF0154147.1 MAG: hypothetical protein FD189_2055 [Elusimicrobiota bacterium]
MALPEILYLDDELIIACKPAGMLTIPARGPLGESRSLLELLREEHGDVFTVHRLDREVSGAAVFARSRKAHAALCGQFERREVLKLYLAAAHGRMEDDEGEIDKPVQEYGSGRMGVGFDGKPSVTCYKVIGRLKTATLLEVDLKTGRRHQIRVHFYYIGHPLVGDPLYGDKLLQEKYPRLMLHSWRLGLVSPSGKKISVEAEPSPDFTGVLDCL